MEGRAAALVDALAAGDYPRVRQHLHGWLLEVSTDEQLHYIWQDLLRKNGAYRGRRQITRMTVDDAEVVYVVLQFERAALAAALTFDTGGELARLTFVDAKEARAWRPPVYAKVDTFTERHVRVGLGRWPLPGTLTMPKLAEPVRAVVLVASYGPLDRDQAFGPNKPFKDLAWALATRGIAVLRYDKRPKWHSGLVKTPFTAKEETIDDAVAAVTLVRTMPGIDPKHVFVLGHGLSATVAPRIAEASGQVAGLVLLAPMTPENVAGVLVEQTERFVRSDGKVMPEERAIVERSRREAIELQELYRTRVPTNHDLFDAPPSYWLDLAEHATTRDFGLPVLVVHGSRESLLTSKDIALYRKAMSGNKAATLRVYGDLSALFMAAERTSHIDELNRPSHIDVRVIEDVARFIAGA